MPWITLNSLKIKGPYYNGKTKKSYYCMPLYYCATLLFLICSMIWFSSILWPDDDFQYFLSVRKFLLFSCCFHACNLDYLYEKKRAFQKKFQYTWKFYSCWLKQGNNLINQLYKVDIYWRQILSFHCGKRSMWVGSFA